MSSATSTFFKMVLPACLALLIGLWLGNQQQVREREQAAKREADLRRQIARQAEFIRAPEPRTETADPSELRRVQASLESANGQNAQLSNTMARVLADADLLRQNSSNALAQAAALVEAAKAEVRERSRRIEWLEGELGALGQQLRDLGERLSRQTARIADAERQLASATGDRTELAKTLNALQAEKAELESRLVSKTSQADVIRRARDEELSAREAIFRRGWLAATRNPRPTQEPAPAPRPRSTARKVVASDVEVASPESPGNALKSEDGRGARSRGGNRGTR